MEELIHRFGPLERVIETQLSRTFLFNDVAVKWYRHQSTFFGNLGDSTFRKAFYEEDFFWNHDVAPEIYLELVDIADDCFIIMKRILSDRNLTNLLEAGEVTNDGLARLVDMLVEKLRHLSQARHDKLAHIFAEGWRKLHADGLEDLRQFALDAPSIDCDAVHEVVDVLQEASVRESYFDDNSVLSATIDTNGDNLLFLDDLPTCIDILPVKENWRVVDEYCTVLRVAVDAEALGSKELGDVVRLAYAKHREPAPRSVTLIYEIRAGLIQWAYRLYLGQPERAERYMQFVLAKNEALRAVA